MVTRFDDGEVSTRLLREFAIRADREDAGTRWSYCRDIGGTRVIMMGLARGQAPDAGRGARC